MSAASRFSMLTRAHLLPQFFIAPTGRAPSRLVRHSSGCFRVTAMLAEQMVWQVHCWQCPRWGITMRCLPGEFSNESSSSPSQEASINAPRNRMNARKIALWVTALCMAVGTSQAQKIKVIVDQDARGPATTDMQSILIFLQSNKFDVLGITTVTGDQWVKEETKRTLRLLEIAGRTDVPVAQGAEFPLLNSKEESERWEALYGKFRYKGCWSDFSNRPASTPPAFRAGYHEPDVIPPLVEGAPHTKPLDETAAHFIVRMVHKYPGEVVIWAGGPLTNIALALRLDPAVATLAKELVLMGSGMYSDNGGIGGVDGRREFNWWFDPEAVRMTMRAPWKKIVITPIDIS